MSLKTEHSLLFWLIFLAVLASALIAQSGFLPAGGLWGPYLTWPPLIFCFLYYGHLTSLFLVFVISLLSSALFSLSLPAVFFLYFLCFLTVFFVKTFFFSKSSLLFFILVFFISLCFPYLADLSYNFSIDDFSWSANLFYFSKAFATLVLSILLYPLLKKHLQDRAKL